MGMSYGAALQSGSNAILYRHQRSFTPTPPRAKLSREEPDAGNLHVRVREGWGWQHPHLLGQFAQIACRQGGAAEASQPNPGNHKPTYHTGFHDRSTSISIRLGPSAASACSIRSPRSDKVVALCALRPSP